MFERILLTHVADGARCNHTKPQLKTIGFGTLGLWGLIAVLAGGFILHFINKNDWLGVGLISFGLV
jgi:hypothetical protein